MEFPELKLKQKAKEREEKDNIINKEIVDEYDFTEREIKESDLKINKVYDGVKVKQRSYAVNDYVIIENNDNYYVVIRVMSKKKWYPLVVGLDKLEIVKNFTADGVSGNWNLTNNYVSFSKKNGKTMYYLHNILSNIEPDGSGKDSIDHLNRIKLDNRLENLKLKSQSEQNVNQKVRKCASKQLENMPQPYRDYYLENRPRYIYWLYSKTHGHRIFAGPLGLIKEKKFSSKDPSMIPKLMQKAEEYLITESIKNKMSEDQITSELDIEASKLKNEYIQIVMKAAHFFHLDL